MFELKVTHREDVKDVKIKTIKLIREITGCELKTGLTIQQEISSGIPFSFEIEQEKDIETYKAVFNLYGYDSKVTDKTNILVYLEKALNIALDNNNQELAKVISSAVDCAIYIKEKN